MTCRILAKERKIMLPEGAYLKAPGRTQEWGRGLSSSAKNRCRWVGVSFSAKHIFFIFVNNKSVRFIGLRTKKSTAYTQSLFFSLTRRLLEVICKHVRALVQFIAPKSIFWSLWQKVYT